MKKILLTGASGFIGSNILPILRQKKEYLILSPGRLDINLKDEREVKRYLKKEAFDVVIHLASPTPLKNKMDSFDNLMEDSMRIFMDFYNNRDLFGKMIYTGSGAEYNKALDISKASETDCFRSVPHDSYGLSKMIMNQLAEASDNIYNFRVMGCYGPRDHSSKFITHCIQSVLMNIPITIRKDCKFDYMHVYDLAKYIQWGIEADLKYHNYNMSTGQEIWLSDIAREVLKQMNSSLSIKILSEEKNFNYTANNTRLIEESQIAIEYSIEKGIAEQIKWEKENFKLIEKAKEHSCNS